MDNPKKLVRGDVAEDSEHTAEELAAKVNDLLPTMADKLINFIREVPGTDITLVQEFLLRHLQVHGPCTASTIGFMMGITSGPVTSLTKRLIAKGLLQRNQDQEDGRVYWFSLTPAGEAIGMQLSAYRQTQWTRVVEQLGVSRTADAIQLMKDTIHILNDMT